MARHLRLTHLFALGAFSLLLAPSGLARAAVPSAPTRPTVHIVIQNFAFSPRTLVVSVGTTVVWTNEDMAPHTVTSDTGAWASSMRLFAGQSFALTFVNPGAFSYHCAIHPFMTATLIVRPASPAPPAHRHGTIISRTVELHPLDGSGVTGSAMFRYTPATGLTHVTLVAQHLQPYSVHPAHIHAGSNCTLNRPILYSFAPLHGAMMGMGLRADGAGTLRGQVTFAGSFVGKVWHINVHMGPGLGDMAQFRVLACGVL